MDFVILLHPLEHRRRVATGRMSHLCLENSFLIRGHDYSKHELVTELANDPARQSVILYPGPTSKNLTLLSDQARQEWIDRDKKLTIFVIDGTWATAKKTIKHSANLRHLPRICFTPPRPSEFRVRKQPHAGCFSTIEAIHHTIDLIGPSCGFDTTARTHDGLLRTFDFMVEQQLDFLEDSRKREGPSRYKKSKLPQLSVDGFRKSFRK